MYLSCVYCFKLLINSWLIGKVTWSFDFINIDLVAIPDNFKHHISKKSPYLFRSLSTERLSNSLIENKSCSNRLTFKDILIFGISTGIGAFFFFLFSVQLLSPIIIPNKQTTIANFPNFTEPNLEIMKNKFLIVLTIAILSANITNAQEQKFHFGLKVAPTIAWMKPDTKDLNKDGSKLGFTYGLMGESNFASNYALTYGLQVTYRGGILNYESAAFSTRTSYVLKYVELPIGIKMKTNEFNRYRYFGQFGLVPGLNLSAKTNTEKGSITESNIESKANITDINMSMMIALGAEYTISGSTTFLVSLEFNNGFVDVLAKSKDTDPEFKAISNYFAVNLGIMF